MKNVSHILRSKPVDTVHTIAPSATMYDALKLMADKNIGALVVVEGSQILGILTERDYARKIALQGRSSKETRVSEVMSSPVMYVDPNRSTEECMVLMTETRLRHLPVLENGKLVGLVSIGDLVKDIISEQSFIIEELQRYIAGSIA